MCRALLLTGYVGSETVLWSTEMPAAAVSLPLSPGEATLDATTGAPECETLWSSVLPLVGGRVFVLI
jgi:hypothetical protein